MIGEVDLSTWRKPAPVPLCPPQIPNDQIRAAAVGSRHLTARATTARPGTPNKLVTATERLPTDFNRYQAGGGVTE
jgi:hypothetical protein